MAPPLLTLRDARVTFGGKPLFEGITLSMHVGDKICLVGRNGSGKSTLMKLITGEREPDGGERFLQPGTRIGYLPQQIIFPPNCTIYDYVLADVPGDEETIRYQADKVLSPFELTGDMLMHSLSGGQQRRAALAQALLEAPDILLLDEPTNHLDIDAILWLEIFIKSYRGALLCVSHDRAFLAAITQKTFLLDRGKILVNSKGYEDFDRWTDALADEEEARLQKLGRKLEEEEHWRERGVTARRKRNMRRMADLRTLRENIKRERSQFMQISGSVQLPALSSDNQAKLVVEMEQVSKSFGEKKILQRFSTRIMRGDKIGVIGKNGSGKSTFLKLITGALEADEGKIKRGVRLQTAYFDQTRASLNPEETLWHTLCPQGGDEVMVGDKNRHVVAYLKDFLFTPDQAKSPVSSLSGGEANRLLLAKILAKYSNLLILDEPTNDLDMDTLDMLQELLADYKGTLILVSHDRDFLDRIVTRTIVFEGDANVQEYVGGYQDYLAQRQVVEKKKDAKPEKQKEDKEERAKSKKLSYKHQRALEQLPGQMEKLRREIIALEAELADSSLYQKNYDRFQKLTDALDANKQALAEAEETWFEAEMAREELD